MARGASIRCVASYFCRALAPSAASSESNSERRGCASPFSHRSNVARCSPACRAASTMLSRRAFRSVRRKLPIVALFVSSILSLRDRRVRRFRKFSFSKRRAFMQNVALSCEIPSVFAFSIILLIAYTPTLFAQNSAVSRHISGAAAAPPDRLPAANFPLRRTGRKARRGGKRKARKGAERRGKTRRPAHRP